MFPKFLSSIFLTYAYAYGYVLYINKSLLQRTQIEIAYIPVFANVCGISPT